MKKQRLVIFIFPLLLAMSSVPAFLGYYTVQKIPEMNVSEGLKKLIVELDQANGPFSEEHKEYIIAYLKVEKSEVQFLEAVLQNLERNYKVLVGDIVVVLCIQIVIAVFLARHVNITKPQSKQSS